MTDPMNTGDGMTIVVAGGSGAVGRRVAERLAPWFPARIVVAGRNRDRAHAVASQVGHGASSEVLDVTDPTTFAAALGRAGAVVSCVEHSEPSFVRACLARGAHYVDVTADGEGIAAIESLDALARASGAVAVLSVGLAPGLTNLLAREVCSTLDRVDRLDLGVQLDTLDAHGAAAIAWTLDNLTTPFAIVRDGVPCLASPLARRRTLDFGGPHADDVFAFNFPEQRTLARTLDVPTVASWLSLRPGAIHNAVVVSARLRLTRLLRSARARRLLAAGLSRLPMRSAGCAISAEALGMREGRVTRVATWRTGRGEAELTAGVAAYLTHRLLAHREPAGVRHIEQLSRPDKLLADLAQALDLVGPSAPSE